MCMCTQSSFVSMLPQLHNSVQQSALNQSLVDASVYAFCTVKICKYRVFNKEGPKSRALLYYEKCIFYHQYNVHNVLWQDTFWYLTQFEQKFHFKVPSILPSQNLKFLEFYNLDTCNAPNLWKITFVAMNISTLDETQNFLHLWDS